MHDADVTGVYGGHHRGTEQLAVADGREVEVQDDGVVDSKSHQYSDQVVLSQVTLLSARMEIN